MNEAYNFKLDSFEGPLDLLWHLIKSNEMDIFDLELELIIQQYLEFIEAMEELNLDIASSYLIMAAELLELKSKLLLPSYDDEEEEEDLTQNLVDKLVEYQKYKDVLEDFRNLEKKRQSYFTKLPEPINDYIKENDSIDLGNLSLDDLAEAFQKFLKNKHDEKPIPQRISKKELTVEEQIDFIKNKFKKHKKINFFELFESFDREEIVVSFLAILEMAKEGKIVIKQEDNFENIYCEVIE